MNETDTIQPRPGSMHPLTFPILLVVGFIAALFFLTRAQEAGWEQSSRESQALYETALAQSERQRAQTTSNIFVSEAYHDRADRHERNAAELRNR